MNQTKPKYWIRVTVPCTPEAFEAVSNFLFETGATGLEESEDSITGYFPEPASAEKLGALIHPFTQSLQHMGLDVSPPQFMNVPLEDWGRKWRESFGPLQVTKRIRIWPPWIEDPDPPDGITLRIMPRMAFGTGSHETTQLCLELLEENLQPGQSVLDVGTGSGILAIAAIRLGAEKATGVDVDPESFENAEENAGLNQVKDAIRFYCGDVTSIPELKADLILANINRTVLKQVIPQLSAFAYPETTFILSGLLETESDQMCRFLIHHEFEILTKRQKGEWIGFVIKSVNPSK
ncbi:50S ribosomal protein L11 methyltransferase [candidate division KSB1 bacterium]|nr:50S ribosomal protein L11 methyltransferase [candidate division KSB1 bacterium]